MVTVIGIASLDLSITHKKRLTAELGDVVTSVFP